MHRELPVPLLCPSVAQAHSRMKRRVRVGHGVALLPASSQRFQPLSLSRCSVPAEGIEPPASTTTGLQPACTHVLADAPLLGFEPRLRGSGPRDLPISLRWKCGDGESNSDLSVGNATLDLSTTATWSATLTTIAYIPGLVNPSWPWPESPMQG